jgi:hypothetical protein
LYEITCDVLYEPIRTEYTITEFFRLKVKGDTNSLHSDAKETHVETRNKQLQLRIRNPYSPDSKNRRLVPSLKTHKLSFLQSTHTM